MTSQTEKVSFPKIDLGGLAQVMEGKADVLTIPYLGFEKSDVKKSDGFTSISLVLQHHVVELKKSTVKTGMTVELLQDMSRIHKIEKPEAVEIFLSGIIHEEVINLITSTYVDSTQKYRTRWQNFVASLGIRVPIWLSDLKASDRQRLTTIIASEMNDRKRFTYGRSGLGLLVNGKIGAMLQDFGGFSHAQTEPSSHASRFHQLGLFLGCKVTLNPRAKWADSALYFYSSSDKAESGSIYFAHKDEVELSWVDSDLSSVMKIDFRADLGYVGNIVSSTKIDLMDAALRPWWRKILGI